MGITIHFRGKLQNLLDIHSLQDELIDICKIMEWEWSSLDEDWNKPCSAKLEFDEGRSEITGHLPLKGVAIKLHPDCETLSLYFDPSGNLSSPISMIMINEGRVKADESYTFVKTQFAPPDIHISIIKLLQFLKNRYIPNLEVHDEGEYWESGEKDKLMQKIDFLNMAMDKVEQALSSVDSEQVKDYSAEDLAKLLEEILRKKL